MCKSESKDHWEQITCAKCGKEDEVNMRFGCECGGKLCKECCKALLNEMLDWGE